MRVDVHAHAFPTEYLEYLDRLGSQTTHYARGAPAASATIEERLALMDEAGIEMQVLSASAQQPYFDRADDAVSAARLVNDGYADLGRRYSGRFGSFASLPLPHVDHAVEELDRALDQLGALGVCLGCSVGDLQLDDPSFEPLYAHLDRRAAVVFLHPMGLGFGPRPEDYGLNWMVGAPFEDTLSALRLILSGVVVRYPNIRFIVPHLGGTLPLLLQRIDDSHARRGAHPSVEGNISTYARRLWYDSISGHPPVLRCACESYGVDRLLLGTDFPFLPAARFKQRVTYVEQSLPRQDADAILNGNAAKLLGLATVRPSG